MFQSMRCNQSFGKSTKCSTDIGNSSERRFNQAICNTIITIFLKVDCLDCWGSYIHLSKYWWIVMYSIVDHKSNLQDLVRQSIHSITAIFLKADCHVY